MKLRVRVVVQNIDEFLGKYLVEGSELQEVVSEIACRYYEFAKSKEKYIKKFLIIVFGSMIKFLLPQVQKLAMKFALCELFKCDIEMYNRCLSYILNLFPIYASKEELSKNVIEWIKKYSKDKGDVFEIENLPYKCEKDQIIDRWYENKISWYIDLEIQEDSSSFLNENYLRKCKDNYTRECINKAEADLKQGREIDEIVVEAEKDDSKFGKLCNFFVKRGAETVKFFTVVGNIVSNQVESIGMKVLEDCSSIYREVNSLFSKEKSKSIRNLIKDFSKDKESIKEFLKVIYKTEDCEIVLTVL